MNSFSHKEIYCVAQDLSTLPTRSLTSDAPANIEKCIRKVKDGNKSLFICTHITAKVRFGHFWRSHPRPPSADPTWKTRNPAHICGSLLQLPPDLQKQSQLYGLPTSWAHQCMSKKGKTWRNHPVIISPSSSIKKTVFGEPWTDWAGTLGVWAPPKTLQEVCQPHDDKM